MVSKNPIKFIVLLVVAAVLLLIAGFGLYNGLKVTQYSVTDLRIPSAFDGFRIAQLSDYHDEWYGEGQRELIDAVASGNPDIIVLTGDIFDAFTSDHKNAIDLLEGLTEIAPVYAVSGNHEEAINTKKSFDIDSFYQKYGIKHLNNTGTKITRNGSEIIIYGLSDRKLRSVDDVTLEGIPIIGKDAFGILLYHRSDFFDYVNSNNFGLVLSGHTHGGLIRIPFVGGIITPEGKIDFNQKYDGGMYTVNGNTLISNKGLAPSHNIPRIFNRSEVVFITLFSKQ